MKQGFIKLSACTPSIVVGDSVKNAAQILEVLGEAAGRGVRVAVLPELCLTGYTCEDLFLQGVVIEGALAGLRRILDGSHEMELVFAVGMPVAVGSCLYNCAVVCYRGRVLGVVPKTRLPNYGEFYEKRHFCAAPDENMEIRLLDEYVPFGRKLIFQARDMAELCIGFEICEDLWAPEQPSIGLARAGATIIGNLSASDETVGKREYRRQLVRGQSGRLVCAYIYADAGDGESTTDMVFAGHNLIAENGTVLEESELFKNGVISTEVDVQRLSSERRRMFSYDNQNTNDYRTVTFDMPSTETTLTRRVDPHPFVPDDESQRAERCESVLGMQTQGLATRLIRAHCKAAVLGISGGLDSCLALLVSVRAMDKLGWSRSQVRAITMPCFGTTTRTRSNAEMLSEALGVTFAQVDITAAVSQHFADIGQDPRVTDVTFENCQARERTQVLMDIANRAGGLVVGTGDLSELALGWATYNGDHMSMYGVNASVPKTLVRHLVRYEADMANVAGKSELCKVLLDILATPVSPELLPAKDGTISQVTEDIVGPYELHDFFLYQAIRWATPPRKVLRLAKAAFAGVYDDDTILKWLRMFYQRFFAQQFKRSCLPDGPKIGSVALSPRGDWRMPSDASVEAWRRELE